MWPFSFFGLQPAWLAFFLFGSSLFSASHLLVTHFPSCNYSFNLFLYEDLSYNTASANAVTRHTWSPNRKYRTKHGAIQKDSVQCIVGSPYFGSMLSSNHCSIGFHDCSRRERYSVTCTSMGIYPSLPQFVIEPSSLLLEDQRSSTSSERNYSRGLRLFLILKKRKILRTKAKKTFLYKVVYLLYPFKAMLLLLNHNNIISAKITDVGKFYLKAVYLSS